MDTLQIQERWKQLIWETDWVLGPTKSQNAVYLSLLSEFMFLDPDRNPGGVTGEIAW